MEICLAKRRKLAESLGRWSWTRILAIWSCYSDPVAACSPQVADGTCSTYGLSGVAWRGVGWWIEGDVL